MIRLSHIEKTYFGKGNETHALKNVNLKIQDNELCAIMGASGSGKSTLLHIIGAMDDVTGGSYLYNDIPVSKLSKKDLHGFRKKYVSFVFQNFALIERYSVYENLEVPLLARSVKKRKHIIEDAAERVGISDLLRKYPSELSGGQQQRCAIARALIADTELLLCDEPTGALDYQTGKAILKLLQDTSRERGMTVIVITHNSALTPMADRVIKIKNGKVSKMYLNENPEPIENIEW